MEVNYGRRPPFSLGVEEEFQLVDAESCELVSRSGEVIEAAGSGPAIKRELLQSVVEVATEVCSSVSAAMEQVRLLRVRLRDAAAERGALMAGAGTHPFSRYEHQEVTDEPRYRELVDALRWVAERELVFGLHVHVGLDSPSEAINVANGLRTALPELLALSANSPFWQGRDTGLASTRSKVFDTMPRSGLPPVFSSFEEFEQVIDRGVRTSSFPDYTYIWWDLRPHPQLGTIEMRICDAQTRVESTEAIVALVQSLVATLSEDYEREGALPTQPALLIAENKWRAVRHGLDTDLVWLERDVERPAREAVLALVERAYPAARRLGCADSLDTVEQICDRGTGADEQRKVLAERGSLLAVAQRLAEQTVHGL
ncbi:MAG: glutamate--cysteine ligase [Actinobacteria bacterium]|nr:glutamate--cysteine ligase [Actinomycetota bacterium]